MKFFKGMSKIELINWKKGGNPWFLHLYAAIFYKLYLFTNIWN